MRKVNSWKNKLYSVFDLKENVEIVVKLGTSHFSARIVSITMVEITETEPEQIFARTVAIWAMTRRVASIVYIAKVSSNAIKDIDINMFHEMIGHCGVDRLKKTANIHGLKLKGEFKVCEDCEVAKLRQRNVSEDWKSGIQVSGEIVYLDISSIKGESYGGSCFWALVVDDHTDYCWSLFLKAKSDLKGKFLTLLIDLKIAGLDVKFI
jgi:hypothetical protein